MKRKTNISVQDNRGIRVTPSIILGDKFEGYASGDLLDANAVKSLVYDDPSDIPDGSITTAKLADGAVTEPKLADGATTANKIANGTISLNKINEEFREYIDNHPTKDEAIAAPSTPAVSGQILKQGENGPEWADAPEGSVMDSQMSDVSENPVQNKVIKQYVDALQTKLENGELTPLLAENLAAWADQKAIATPDTYTDAVRTTGGDIPIETSAGSKLENIKPVAGSKWTAKLLFNGSYNMLNAAKWGATNTQSYVGGVGDDFVYFLVPELTLGTFGTADENNGLLFTDSEGENVEPASVYFKPLGTTIPQSLTDGTSVTPTSVSYDGKTYKDYATDGAGWLIIPKTVYDNDVCAHIAWEDWYDKYVSLDEPTTNPEAVVGVLMLEGLLALAHSDKYLRGINEETCDNVVFGETSATITHMVDELSVAANAWTNSATGESDSHGNALYRHSTTVSGIKQGGAACVEGEDGGIPLTVIGTTVSYIDTNATAPASVVFYEVTATSTTKAYTDSVFSGSNINTETGVLPINDCSIEAQVAMDGEANITVKYAKNIVDQVAINATVDVPQIKHEVEEHEERITELEDTAVRTGSYDASVAVGLADNFKGDTIVNAEFYKRKTGGTQSVGSGIAAIKEVRGKSIVWNQKQNTVFSQFGLIITKSDNGIITINGTGSQQFASTYFGSISIPANHYIYIKLVKLEGEITLPEDASFVAKVTTGYDTGVDMESGGSLKETSIYAKGGLGIIMPVGTTFTNYKCKIICCDLTLMFGAGNEPATTTEFEKMFPLDYYDYNAGEVIPFAGQNLTTTGFNQFNGEYEEGSINPTTGENQAYSNTKRCVGFIPVLSDTNYYCQQVSGTAMSIWMAFYDANKNIISEGLPNVMASANVRDVKNKIFTMPSNCAFVRFYTKNDTDVLFNISNEDRNGTYEPYEKHTLPLDPSQWRDKNGNLVFPYGGMHGVGTAYDYAKVDADGYIRKGVKVFERRTYESGDTELTNVITDGRTYTFYPLETPVEVELGTPVYAKYLVDKDGTEEITPANGSTPYTTMANLSILYAMDARGEIKNLPKNYLSKESTENMLNAMVTAGVIASYTMTWDAANGRYAFVITAPVEPEPEETQS